MKFIKHIFSALTPSFLIKNYFFGALLTAFFIWMVSNTKGGLDSQIAAVIVLVINLIFYPFSTLIYEEVRNMLLGNNVLVADVKVMLFAKFTIKVILLCFAVPIGAIGIIYIWFRTKDNA